MAKKLPVSINSRYDFHRQVGAFQKNTPNASLNEAEFRKADAAAMRLDNETERPGGRMEFQISYIERVER